METMMLASLRVCFLTLSGVSAKGRTKWSLDEQEAQLRGTGAGSPVKVLVWLNLC